MTSISFNLQPYLSPISPILVGNRKINVYTLSNDEVKAFVDQFPDYALIHTGAVEGFYIFSYLSLQDDINVETGRPYGFRLYRNIHIGHIENEEEIERNLKASHRLLANTFE